MAITRPQQYRPPRHDRRPVIQARAHTNLGTPAGSPIPITLVTASCDLAGVALSGVALSSSAVWVTLATAQCSMVAQPLEDIELVAAGVEIDLETATCDLVANPVARGVGDGIPGATYGWPVRRTGPTGSVLVDLSGCGVEDGEPAGWDRTWWMLYTCTETGFLTFTAETAAGDFELAQYEGETLADLVAGERADYVTGGDAPSITVAVVAGGFYHIRIGSDTAITTTLSWSMLDDTNSVMPVDAMVLTLAQDTVYQAPAALVFDLTGGTPGDDITATVVGTTITTDLPTDTSGNISGGSVPLDDIDAGTYTLRITDTSTAVAEASFQVENDPAEAPEPLGDDDPPSETGEASHVVVHWVLQDPMPAGLGSYVFPINPERMTSPHSPRTVTYGHTAARSGQEFIWEGGARAVQWQFSGTSLTQDQHENLVAFLELRRRFYVIDHRNRAWVCTFQSIQWQPFRPAAPDWCEKYTVTALIYSGPTAP